MRSHPPTLLRHVERALRGPCEISRGGKLLVAVSGGPDSMALLHCLTLLQGRLGYQLRAATVDHGLRPEASQETELVRIWCEGVGIPCSVLRLDLQAGANVQARAREARYDVLSRVADEWSREALLVTAHQRDDRAETVLLRILRGTSAEGLGVLRERQGRRIRPMIRATRRDVALHLSRHEVPFCSDPSNHNPAFLRVRVRHELLPLLENLSPQVAEHLCALADEMSAEEPLGLNREQRRQLRNALENPNIPAEILLPQGLRVTRAK